MRWWPSVRRGPLLAVAAWLIGIWLLGPWVVLAGLALLAWPWFRWWIRPERPVAMAAGVAACAVLVAGLTVVVPDGWLPLPPGAGVMTAPGYLGRAATPRPVAGYDVPAHPALAANGTSSRHNDAWASNAYPWSGPLGDRIEVDTAWYGAQECATLALDAERRLVALCRDGDGPALHLIDPDSMRKRASHRLPESAAGGARCRTDAFYLDAAGRAVVATADRRIVVLDITETDGGPRLVQSDGIDLTATIAPGDCLVGLMPSLGERIWFVSGAGLVGIADTATRQVHVHDVGEPLSGSFAVDLAGAAYLISGAALYRFDAGPGGAPRRAWRTAHHRAPGDGADQSAPRGGSTPTLLPDGLVAITSAAESQTQVVFLRRSDGSQVCRAAVFDADAGTGAASLVGLGTGVVVANHHGYAGPRSTLLGASTTGGMARVDVAGGACRVRWSNDETSPSSLAKASLANGLVYSYTKRSSWWGVAAWYLTATDVVTGRRVFSARTGFGIWANQHHGGTALTPDGSLFLATIGGLIRVRDRV